MRPVKLKSKGGVGIMQDKTIWTPVIVFSGSLRLEGYHVASERDFRVILSGTNIFFDFDKKRIINHGINNSGRMVVSIRPRASH